MLFGHLKKIQSVDFYLKENCTRRENAGVTSYKFSTFIIPKIYFVVYKVLNGLLLVL